MNGGLLLDTCACLWIAEGAEISVEAMEALNLSMKEGGGTYVSPFMAWEVGMLMSRGRIASTVGPEVWFRAFMSNPNVQLALLTPDILIQSSYLPGQPPKDPADRIVIATARNHGLGIVTRDQLILGYAAEGHVRAIKC